MGQILTWTQATDAVTNVHEMQYDPVNQLLAVTVRGNSLAGAILKQYAHGYDAGGNRTTEQIATGADSPVAIDQAQYNANNQLTSRSGGAGRILFSGRLDKEAAVTVAGTDATIDHRTTNFSAYVDVASGTNVIPVVATDYNGNSTTNRYQVVTTDNGVATILTFDLNGNQTMAVTATSTNSYQWDAANRLVGITSPTNQSVFTYDGAGRRVQIVEAVNGVAVSTNRYVWDGVELGQERTVAGAVTKRFFNQGEQIAGTNYYFTRDHLGSIREMVDDAGTVQARYDYDPYGRRTKVAGAMDADFGYTGHFYHSPSGLWLTLYRAYDPDLGRWLSRDPIGEEGGINLYDYVLNNPVNMVDRLGLFSLSCFAKGAVRGVLWAAATAAVSSLAVGLGAPIGIVTGVLYVVGAVSGGVSAAVIWSDRNDDDALSYDLGALAGSAGFGLRSGRPYNKAMSPPGETSAPGWPEWKDWGKGIKPSDPDALFPSPSDVAKAFGKGPTLPSGALGVASGGTGGSRATRGGSGGGCN